MRWCCWAIAPSIPMKSCANSSGALAQPGGGKQVQAAPLPRLLPKPPFLLITKGVSHALSDVSTPLPAAGPRHHRDNTVSHGCPGAPIALKSSLALGTLPKSARAGQMCVLTVCPANRRAHPTWAGSLSLQRSDSAPPHPSITSLPPPPGSSLGRRVSIPTRPRWGLLP